MLKLCENPPMTPPEVGSLTDLAGTWWVAHTKARFEKALAFDLLERGIGYFLPLSLRIKISGGRKRQVMLPVFSSYVFFCGDTDDRYAAISTGRLCQVIEVKDQAGMIRQLSAVERALRGSARLDPYPHPVIGQRCRVSSGPFEGLEGTVVSQSRLARLVLEVGILGQGASMEVDVDLLEPMDERPVERRSVRGMTGVTPMRSNL